MKLLRLDVKSFAGINPKAPVVLDFTESNYYTATGDQGSGKTSLLNSLLVACGQLSHTGDAGKEFINNQTGEIDINFSFIGKDKLPYEVRCTKTQFKLTYEGAAVSKPITKMKELLGVVGVSPMEIKEKPIAEIVKWLSSYSNIDSDAFLKKMKKIKDAITESAGSRALANRQYKAIKDYLENEPLYLEWAQSEEKFKVKPDIDALAVELKTARDESGKLDRANDRLVQLTNDKANIEVQIDRLRAELLAKEKQLTDVNTAIETGNKFLEDNKEAKTKYEAVQVRYDNIAKDVVAWDKWQTIKEKKKQMDEYETFSQQADIKEKQLKEDRKVLQADIIPDVRGVELVTEDNFENGVLQMEGLYWNGKTSKQLSESEWWELVMQIWKKYKVKIVVIDNAQSLGSKATERLEKLAKDGTFILAAEMSRGQEVLEILYV